MPDRAADCSTGVVRVRLDAGSLSFAVGPAIALLALAGIMLFLRWAFGSSPATRARRRAPELLTRVATVSRPETAQALRAVLSDAGIRSTARATAPLRTDVLVFPEDADRARALVLTFGGAG